MNKFKLIPILLCFAVCQGMAQSNMDHVEIKPEKVAENIYILYGRGGNIGLAIGQDYAYMIDAQFSALSDKILATVKSITDKPVKFVINTHWHGDHTGGNENMANQGATIIAHENVRNRMSTYQKRSKGRVSAPKPFNALPAITFSDDLTIHLDSTHTMLIFHVHSSHTDGDAYVYFPESNVIHLGDNLPNTYPFIDVNAGGAIDGFIKNLNNAIFICDEDTKIIPGHGKLTDRKYLVAYRDMIDTIRLRVKKAKDSGKTLEEVQALKLSAEWDEKFGQGFIAAEPLIAAIYQTVE